MTINRVIRDIPYAAEITVEYVSETDPDQPTGAPTWAKRVTIAVSTPALQVGGTPLSVDISRVFTYDRITSTP